MSQLLLLLVYQGEEVKRDIHWIRKGRETGPDEIFVDFFMSTGGVV